VITIDTTFLSFHCSEHRNLACGSIVTIAGIIGSLIVVVIVIVVGVAGIVGIIISFIIVVVVVIAVVIAVVVVIGITIIAVVIPVVSATIITIIAIWIIDLGKIRCAPLAINTIATKTKITALIFSIATIAIITAFTIHSFATKPKIKIAKIRSTLIII
jgi:hypothetical protein